MPQCLNEMDCMYACKRMQSVMPTQSHTYAAAAVLKSLESSSALPSVQQNSSQRWLHNKWARSATWVTETICVRACVSVRVLIPLFSQICLWLQFVTDWVVFAEHWFWMWRKDWSSLCQKLLVQLRRLSSLCVVSNSANAIPARTSPFFLDVK